MVNGWWQSGGHFRLYRPRPAFCFFLCTCGTQRNWCLSLRRAVAKVVGQGCCSNASVNGRYLTESTTNSSCHVLVSIGVGKTPSNGLLLARKRNERRPFSQRPADVPFDCKTLPTSSADWPFNFCKIIDDRLNCAMICLEVCCVSPPLAQPKRERVEVGLRGGHSRVEQGNRKLQPE